VYCARTTDTVALFATLRELARAEREFNRAHGIGSTCDIIMPPGVVADGGVCRATSGSGYPYSPYGP
jgi:hypothetical protein